VPDGSAYARHVLDYGAGHGDDAATYGWQPYDPNFNGINEVPSWPERWSYIICTYVLCVCNAPEVTSIMQDIWMRLRPGGVAYLAVRRDKRELGITLRPGDKSTLQSDVYLNLPRVICSRGFDIYEWRKDAGCKHDISEEQAFAYADGALEVVGTGGAQAGEL
jgi:hypothetical protein